MQGKELDEKFTNTELGALKDELEREKQKRKITEEEQKKELDEVKLLLAKVLKKGIKTLGEVETKLK